METLSIITNNPYRILGVFFNSPKKDIVANKGKLSAFLKVGKTIEFPLDLKAILPPIQRSIDSLSQAESALSLAKDQLRYVLFWFVKQTSIDDIAFNHLKAGDVDTAISIWEKKTSFSSLQNIMICTLIKGDYQRAFSNANILFDEYLQNYVDLLSNQITITTTDLIHLFLDCLFEEKGINHSMFLNLIDNNLWNDYIKTKQVQPLIDSISKEIEKSASVNRKDYKARYVAGCVLKKNTTNLIKQLKQLLPTTDMQYQILIDKLGLEILQCGIDYFNASKEPDAAMKAMELQKYALSIVIGKAAKDRCKENVDILQKIINELPPMEVFEEDKAIKNELTLYSIIPSDSQIESAKNLIFYCEPYLVSIKEKVEQKPELKSYYVNLSTTIANAALYNVIEEVNTINNENLDSELERDRDHTLYLLMNVLRNAWYIILNIDKMDVSSEFKNGRYKINRNSLYSIIDNLDGFNSDLGGLTYKYFKDREIKIIRMMPRLFRKPSMKSTSGFVKGGIYEDFIDLRTEKEYYSNCKSIRDYEGYIQKYPNGKFKTEAIAKIEEITEEKRKQEEEDAYFKQCSENNVQACKSYLQKYPKGRYVNKINDMIQKNELNKCKSIKDYRKFSEKYPKSKYLDQAKEKMDSIKNSIWLRISVVSFLCIFIFILWITDFNVGIIFLDLIISVVLSQIMTSIIIKKYD